MKRIKAMLVSCILILVTLTPVTVHAKKIDMEGKTWLFIGDSYISERETNNVPDLIAESLGIPVDEYISEAKMGYGFANLYNHNDRIRNYGNSKTVKNILIVQGFWNDRKRRKSAVKKAFTRFIKRLKKKYPNATIYFCQPHWSLLNGVIEDGAYINKDYRKMKADRLPMYKKVCRDNGVIFLRSVTNIMHSKPADYYYLDGRHPENEGRILIANKISDELKRIIEKRLLLSNSAKNNASSHARSLPVMIEKMS